MKQSLKPMSIVVEEIVFISVVHYQRSLYIQGFFFRPTEKSLIVCLCTHKLNFKVKSSILLVIFFIFQLWVILIMPF